jgi:DNA-binding response OmpR family regulator
MTQTPGLAGIPVIMLSARASAAEVTRAYRLGARSYLVKPVGFTALGAVARDLGLPWVLV